MSNLDAYFGGGVVVLVLLAPPALFGVVVVVVAEPSGLVVVEVAEPAGAPGVGVVVVVAVAALSAAGAAAVDVSSAFLLQPASPRLSAAIAAPAASSPVCVNFDIWQVSLSISIRAAGRDRPPNPINRRFPGPVPDFVMEPVD
ncbi:MAG: hypothetical protein JSR98_20665 [Proteobacteria bacterium]|nr:hypothetical protein [Pseudomonadota bacterium]